MVHPRRGRRPSRLAYAEIHPDETRQSAAGFLVRAHAWFQARGVTVQRVLTDNGGCDRSHLWGETCRQLGITAKRTRPYRPQTNGKVERFNRTLLDGWASRRLYQSEQARRAAFGPWLHWYNHHRPHTALGGHPPITRCTNLPGQYTETAQPGQRRAVGAGWRPIVNLVGIWWSRRGAHIRAGRCIAS